MINGLGHRFFYKIFPGKCVICGKNSDRELDLCSKCESELPWITGNVCKKCGFGLDGVDLKTCGGCLKKHFYYDELITPFLYAEPIKSLLSGLKFNNKLIYINVLSQLFAEFTTRHYSDRLQPGVILPVPLHVKRIKSRGYNQPLEIGKLVAHGLDIKFNRFLIVREKYTEPQSTLPEKKRLANVKNAFKVLDPLFFQKNRIEYVAIFDDIVTTGNTVNEMAKVLRQVGVQRIDVWCCAKTNFNK